MFEGQYGTQGTSPKVHLLSRSVLPEPWHTALSACNGHGTERGRIDPGLKRHIEQLKAYFILLLKGSKLFLILGCRTILVTRCKCLGIAESETYTILSLLESGAEKLCESKARLTTNSSNGVHQSLTAVHFVADILNETMFLLCKDSLIKRMSSAVVFVTVAVPIFRSFMSVITLLIPGPVRC